MYDFHDSTNSKNIFINPSFLPFFNPKGTSYALPFWIQNTHLNHRSYLCDLVQDFPKNVSRIVKMTHSSI